MKLYFTTELAKRIKKLKQREPSLYTKIQNKLKLFEQNHRHLTLHNHKLKGKLENVWSVSIEKNFRMLYYVKNDWAVFFLIGTHDEVYKK